MQSSAIVDIGRDLLARRGVNKTICPSEIARHLPTDANTGWRDWMPAVRRAAAARVAAGEWVVTQRGRVVDIDSVSGPVRIGRATPSRDS